MIVNLDQREGLFFGGCLEQHLIVINLNFGAENRPSAELFC